MEGKIFLHLLNLLHDPFCSLCLCIYIIHLKDTESEWELDHIQGGPNITLSCENFNKIWKTLLAYVKCKMLLLNRRFFSACKWFMEIYEKWTEGGTSGQDCHATLFLRASLLNRSLTHPLFSLQVSDNAKFYFLPWFSLTLTIELSHFTFTYIYFLAKT